MISLLFAAGLCALSACGGGGGDSGTFEVSAANGATVTSAISEAATTATVGDDNSSLTPSADAKLLLSLPTESGELTTAQNTVETPSANSEQTSPPPTDNPISGSPLLSSQDSLRSVQATQSNTSTSRTGVSIAPEDIRDQAQANLSFSSQNWGNIQCNGSILASPAIPAQGIQGKILPNGQTLRFGRIVDNSTASGYAFQFTLNPTDSTTSGSHRCELAFAANASSGIPRNLNFWHAFSVQLPDWHGTTDEQAIAQWHAGDTSGGLLPVYTLLVRGSVMRLVLRYDISTIPSRNTTKTIVVWSQTGWTPNRWLNFVTQANVTADTSQNPYVKTWMNGQQIVNYVGPVGYKQPTVQSYAKHGIYHWVDSTNEWDMSIPTRTLKIKRPLIVRDANRLYLQPQIEALLNAE